MRIRTVATVGVATLLVSLLGVAPANAAAAQGCGSGYHTVKTWKAAGGTIGGTRLRRKGNTYCLVVYRKSSWKKKPAWPMSAEIENLDGTKKRSAGKFKSRTKPVKVKVADKNECVHVVGLIHATSPDYGWYSIFTWYCPKR